MAGIETKQSKVLRQLVADGWQLVRHGGEHDIYRHPTKQGTIALPRHRTLSLGVAKTIAKTAGWI